MLEQIRKNDTKNVPKVLEQQLEDEEMKKKKS